MPKKIVLITLLLFFSASIKAQTPTNPAPTTPAEYFKLAKQETDLHQAGAAPFHMTATFTETDEKGKTQQGDYTETWISKDSWKREISIGKFHEVSACAAGIFYLSKTGAVDTGAADALNSLSPTLPDSEDTAGLNQSWSLQKQDLGGIETQQLAPITHPRDNPPAPTISYLFSRETGHLRGTKTQGQGVSYNDLKPTLGRVVPYKIAVDSLGSKGKLNIAVLTFESIAPPPDDAFVIPRAAKGPCELPKATSQHRTRGMIAANDLYPGKFWNYGPGGSVVLHLTLGRDGQIRDVSVRDAPRAALAAAAMEMVRQHPSKPYSQDIDGTITVHFEP